MISLHIICNNSMTEEENLPEQMNLFPLLSGCCYKSKVDRTCHNDRLLLIERSLLPPSGGISRLEISFISILFSLTNGREFQQRVQVTLSFGFDPETTV